MNTNFNEFTLQLEELVEVTRGFEKENYDMGWAFIQGALHAMSGTVDKKIKELSKPYTINICVNESGTDINKIAKELSVEIHKSNLRR